MPGLSLSCCAQLLSESQAIGEVRSSNWAQNKLAQHTCTAPVERHGGDAQPDEFECTIGSSLRKVQSITIGRELHQVGVTAG